MARLEAQGGGDPTSEVVSALEAEKKRLTRDYMNLWFEVSQNTLEEAAQMRTQVGEAHGVTGRSTNNLHEIQQKAVPPSWDRDQEHWAFSYPSEGAVFQEFGAKPHEIRARRAEALAFDWPDAPQEKQKEFAHLEGDLVMFEKVDHPGIPAIGFVRRGRDKADAALGRAGYETETRIKRGERS